MSQIQLERLSTPLEAGKPLLEINNVTVEYHGQGGPLGLRTTKIMAVRNVSFKIDQSEVFSLVGESGSGKTTIGRSIVGLTPVTSGSIKFKGMEVSRLRGRNLLDYRRKVQIIYQDPYGSLTPRQDVFTAVATPLKLLVGERNKERIMNSVKQLLSEVGLDPADVLRKLPHQLSGGERQRVNIARALASNPEMIVADEPVTMLDASQRLNVLSLLAKLKQERNLTVLLITHDLATVKIMGGRIGLIYYGKLVELGSTEAVLVKPFHPYANLLLSASPRMTLLQEMEEEFRTGIEESERVKSGCIFSPRCKYVTETCRKIDPELVETASAHYVACHNKLNQS